MNLPFAFPVRRALPAGVIVLALLALTACGKGDPEPSYGPIKQYVAIGDSYTAGPGLQPVEDEGCLRSRSNYPHLVAEELGISANLVDASCGGAQTKNLLRAQDHDGNVNPPQLDSVTTSTDLVTVSLGLNDSGVSFSLLYICLPSANLASACEKALQASNDDVKLIIDSLARNVKLGLEAIRDRAPNARILFIGYPRALPDKERCPDLLPLSEAAAERLNFATAYINKQFAKTVKKAGGTFIDTYDASTEHTICSSDPWVNGIKDGGANGAALHPTPAYQRYVADRIVAAVDKK